MEDFKCCIWSKINCQNVKIIYRYPTMGPKQWVCKLVFYSARDWSKLHFNTLTEAGWPGEETGFTYNFLIVSMATLCNTSDVTSAIWQLVCCSWLPRLILLHTCYWYQYELLYCSSVHKHLLSSPTNLLSFLGTCWA